MESGDGFISRFAAFANFQFAPKLRHRSGKFKRNISVTTTLLLNRYNDAVLRPVVSLVRYHKSLAGSNITCYRNQAASPVDDDRVGVLMKRISRRGTTVDKERNMHMNPARPAALRVSARRHATSLGGFALTEQQFCPFQCVEDSTHCLTHAQ